ncbi:MAG: TSUP family transporter [Christensenellales bacterium]
MQKSKSEKKNLILSIVSGILVGFINGFFGGGGGMIVVPLFIFLLKLEEKTAHASSIFVILPLSITSAIIYITKGSVNLVNLSVVSIGVIAGGILGSILLKKLNNVVIRIIFSVIMVIAGIKLMF